MTPPSAAKEKVNRKTNHADIYSPALRCINRSYKAIPAKARIAPLIKCKNVSHHPNPYQPKIEPRYCEQNKKIK
jgi:hypothetical protein